MSNLVNDYDFKLPNELIAQSPLLERASSRLLVLNKNTHEIEHKNFSDIVNYLGENDTLVLNNTRVIPARLIGSKVSTNANIEILLLSEESKNEWKCLVKPAKRIKVGDSIDFGNGKIIAECIESQEEGIKILKMKYKGIFLEVLEDLGTMPLPPYITEKLDDSERYQTVYSKNPGSVAAPTAGLHFTDDVFKKLAEKKVTIAYVTLNVGLGTFRPVSVDDVSDHVMHSEKFEISETNAKIIEDSRIEGKRIVVVGTTTVRTLESVMQMHGKIKSCSGETNIFINPGYEFKIVDALITNFHLPKSTLMMLISAFVDRETILDTYKMAIEEEYRFFSFGDSMFIN